MIPGDTFDLWNEGKKKINQKVIRADLHFYEREIWWCSLGYNIGSEENGKNENFERPIIVFRKFGEQVFWGIPLTTKRSIPGSKFEFEFRAEGIIQNAVVPQLRLLSYKRLLRRVGAISFKDFQSLRKVLADLI
jgi:mRNA-degrading endonuclease toxin of MazEF toxin-antitoxin module